MADTVIDPRTVMIHLKYAAFAVATMMGSRWFVDITYFAEPRSSYPLRTSLVAASNQKRARQLLFIAPEQ